jgi:hypothetical protein
MSIGNPIVKTVLKIFDNNLSWLLFFLLVREAPEPSGFLLLSSYLGRSMRMSYSLLHLTLFGFFLFIHSW